MARKNRIAIDALSSKDFSTITAAYSEFDVNPALTNAASLILIQNLTDITVMFSDDGTNDKFPIASDSYILLDLDKFVDEPQISVSAGTRFQAKQVGGTAATTGSLYITVFYPAG